MRRSGSGGRRSGHSRSLLRLRLRLRLCLLRCQEQRPRTPPHSRRLGLRLPLHPLLPLLALPPPLHCRQPAAPSASKCTAPPRPSRCGEQHRRLCDLGAPDGELAPGSGEGGGTRVRPGREERARAPAGELERDPAEGTRLALPPGAGLDECAASGCAHHGARRPAPPKASSAVHIHTAAVEARDLPRSYAARPVHIHSAGASSLVGAKRNRAPTKLRVDDALSMQAHETAPPAREAQARQRGARRGPSAHDGAFPSPERMTPLLTLSTALGIRAQGCAHVVPDAPEQREA